MNQYVIDALWNAAQLALDAKDIEGIKSVIAQLECGSVSVPATTPQKAIQGNDKSIAKSMCALFESHQCFERFLESPNVSPDDFTTKRFREFLEAEGQLEAVKKSIVDECKHRVGHVMEEYSNIKSEYYKNITRLKTRGHYTKNEYILDLPLAA